MLLAEDVTEDDEIDALFSQLQQIVPPSTLVEDILAAVERLPIPTQRSTPKTWEDFGFVVYSGDNDPS
jgi:hypothetical protein